LIICDNASTDSTEAICREYQALDARVRYFRNETNLGPAGNHNKCVALSRGEYFRWHAHDDRCEPTYLARCVDVLDTRSEIVNCHSLTLKIDDRSQPVEDYSFVWDFENPSPSRRFDDFIHVNHRRHVGYEIFGLMRVAAMLTTPLEGPYAHGDRVFLGRMALRGTFYEIPERLFLARVHASQSMQNRPTRAKVFAFLGTGPLPPAEWWDASKKGKLVFPEWNLLKQYWISIGAASLPAMERLKCRVAVCKWAIRNVPKLVRDVIYAIEHVSTQIIDRLADRRQIVRDV
jgi:glycosyltransferase involved in cell wall biosynthesis